MTIAIFLFAVSTMISWSYYGQQAWMYLFGRSKAMEMTNKILFLMFIVIGCFSKYERSLGILGSYDIGHGLPEYDKTFIPIPSSQKSLTRFENDIKGK